MNLQNANRIAQMRRQRGLSQEALADKLGVSRQAVSKWERGEASPDTDNLIMLAQLYGVSLDELLDHKPGGGAVFICDGSPDCETSDSGRDDASAEGQDETDDIGKSIDIPLGASVNIDAVKEYGGLSALIISLTYVAVSAIWGIWHPAWIMLLLIPVIISTIDAIHCRQPKRFNFAVLVSLVYLCLGFFLDAWHPGWVVFLAIPIFYSIPFNSNKAKDGSDLEDDDGGTGGDAD